MKKKETIRTIIYSVLAVLVFGLLFWATYPDVTKKEDKHTYRIVMLGDSIFGECRDETSVSGKLSQLLNEPVFNGALGGTSVSRLNVEKHRLYGMDAFSMAVLSKAIVSGDFGVQQTVQIRENATEYFPDTIVSLKQIDFENTEILLIGHGINDYHGAQKIENESDAEDEYTFKGAYRSIIEELQREYPNLRIILVTPTFTWYLAQGLTCEEYDTGNGLLHKYVEAQLDVAKELNVEVIDLYHDLYESSDWENWQKYTKDGIHPNEEARAMIAGKLAEYLQQNP